MDQEKGHLCDVQIGGIPLPVRRQLDSRCERCDASALTGRRLCQEHLDAKRASDRRSAKKRRTALRRSRRCVDCRKTSKLRRCRPCWKRSRGGRTENQGVGQWRVDPGTNWMRFRGKGRRGRLTREEQIDEDIRDAGFAIEELRKFVEKAAVLKRPEIMGLPTIQRDAARREVGQHLGFSGRILDDLNERYG